MVKGTKKNAKNKNKRKKNEEIKKKAPLYNIYSFTF